MVGQPVVAVERAELSVPFGVVSGKVLTVANYLIFIDDEKPESSFAVAQQDLGSLTSESGILTIETRKPVRDRSGERSRFSFRLANPAASSLLASWYKSGPAAPAAAAAAAAAAKASPAGEEPRIYQARHKHFPFGGCMGRLIVSKDRVAYESVENVGHSFRWQLRDIKEIKRDNPYEIKVVPFVGDESNLELQRSGMESSDYKTLVDRIAAARASAP